MRTTELGGRAGRCDWNPTAPARRQTDTASSPAYGRAHVPSPPMVASTAEIEGFLSLLSRIVRRLATVPAVPDGDRPIRADAATPETPETDRGDEEAHRGRRCLPSS
jgi:hypothetical protein